MIIKHILYFTFFLLVSAPLTAQTTTERSNPQAGNNSLQGVGKASIYNTDMYTGQVNVNIPIYNYSIDGVDAGISVGYSTLGVKVDQVASDVGLNWNLNAGGYITRKVHDLEDDVEVPALKHQHPNSTYYDLDTAAQSGLWTQGPDSATDQENDEFTAVFNNRTINFMIKYPDGVTKDPFSASSTNFRTLHAVATNPSSDVSIDILLDDDQTAYNGNLNCLYNLLPDSSGMYFNKYVVGFRIIDEQGNQFIFHRGDFEMRTYSKPYPGDTVQYYPISRWVLTQVITHNNSVINYTYGMMPVNYPEYVDQSVTQTTPYQGYDNNNNWTTIPASIKTKRDTINYNGFFADLRKIEYPDGSTVDFTPKNIFRADLANTFAIGDITIKGKNGSSDSTQLTYRLNYAYFNSGSQSELPFDNTTATNQYNLRLKLKSIDKIGNDGTTTERYYTFGYNEGHQLPARLSPSQDYFGYANGKPPVPVFGITDNDNDFSPDDWIPLGLLSIPAHTFTFDNGNEVINYGMDKTPDVNYAQSWDLATMTNGLGGKTEFYYTAHVLSNPPLLDTPVAANAPDNYYQPAQIINNSHVPQNEIGGDPSIAQSSDGVCIDHIVTRDGYNQDDSSLISYTYSGGMRFFPYYYFWYEVSDAIHVWSNNFVSPLDDIDGAYHGYSSVLVKQYGYNHELTSVSQYKFTNVRKQPGEFINDDIYQYPSRIETFCGQTVMHRFPRQNMYKYMMGLVTEQDQYDNSGLTTSDHLLKQVINTYKNAENGKDSIINLYNTRNSPVYDIENNKIANVYYCFHQAVAQLVKTTERNYSGGNYIETTHNYGYDTAVENIVRCDTFNDSRGQIFVKNNLYEFLPMIVTHGLLTVNQVPDTFTAVHPVGKDLINLSTGKYIKLVKAVSQGYEVGNQKGIIGGELYGDQTPVTYPTIQMIPLNYPQTLTTVNYDIVKQYSYDNEKNVIQTQYYQKNTYVSAIWDKHLRKKIAEVNNATFNDIAYTSFEGGLTSSGSESDENLSYDSTLITLGDNNTPAVTGKYYYTLERSPFKAITSINIPANNKTYVISFWAKNGVPVVSYTATDNGLTGNVTATMTAQDTAHGWTLYTGLITNCSSAVTIGTDPFYSIGGGSLAIDIDEVRLFPSDASMQSTTYDPIFGVTSKSDTRDNITYYEYDPMGRLKATRDVHGNILSLTKTVVQGGDN